MRWRTRESGHIRFVRHFVGSAPGILASFAVAYAANGVVPNRPLTLAMICPPLRETLASLCDDNVPALLDHLKATFKAHYDTEGKWQTRPFEGEADMLAERTAAGFGLYIATT